MQISQIKSVTAAEFGIAVSMFTDECRDKEHSHPRMIAMALCRELTGLSLPKIGREFCRDHTTVIHACARVKQHPMLRESAERIKGKLGKSTRGWRQSFALEQIAAAAIGEALASSIFAECHASAVLAHGLRHAIGIKPTYFDALRAAA